MNPYIGNEFQLYGVEEYILQNGKRQGIKILHVKNGLGLELCISLDRAADISSLTYKGYNLSYMTPNGYVSSVYYDSAETNWLNSFTAGFLTTAGLNNVGDPCTDQGVRLPLHGSISNTPVDSYSYQVNETEIVIIAIILDETIFSRKIKISRCIKISRTTNSFSIQDTIKNRGDVIEPLEILYHMNIGYPLLSEKSELYIPSTKVSPRNRHAEEDIANWNRIIKPIRNYEERCYYHTMPKNNGSAAIYNQDIGCGLSISYSPNQLDCFTQWKMMGIRDYVLGLEPGNCYPDGRDVMRQKDLLKFISPEETIQYKVNVKILENKKAFIQIKEE